MTSSLRIILLIISLLFLCIYLIICDSILYQKIISPYLLGIISALIGLTCRSFLFQNHVDRNKKEKLLPLKEQRERIREAYFLKYPLLMVFYSVISVSLIHLLFVRNEEITWIHILLLSATNILVGLKVEYPKLF